MVHAEACLQTEVQEFAELMEWELLKLHPKTLAHSLIHGLTHARSARHFEDKCYCAKTNEHVKQSKSNLYTLKNEVGFSERETDFLFNEVAKGTDLFQNSWFEVRCLQS